MKKLAISIFICLFMISAQSLIAVNTSVEMINDVPTICANGAPYNIGGWTVATLGGIWNLSVDEIKQRMDFTKSQGFEVVEIFVPWRKVEWNRGQFYWERIDSLMDYAENIGLYTIIQVTATTAPPWFGDTVYPDAVFYTFDPDSSLHQGEMWGRLSIPGEGSFPIFYHPGFYEQVDTFFVKLINRYKNYPSLFGWTLCLWFTGEYNYPGGGYGIAGFADYSSYTEGLYGTTPPYPLNMLSQAGPDIRSDWLDWTNFRIEKKREVLYHYAPLIKSLDPNHIIIGYPGGGLLGEWDSGYISEIGAEDYSSMLAAPNIDVIRGAPKVSKDIFDIVNNETSLVPYLLTGNIRAGYRNGKPYLLQCERACDSTSLVQEIKVWAEFNKSLGCDLLWWEEPDTNTVSGNWLIEEKTAIGNTRDISNLSKISKLTKSDFAFIDLPFGTGKYYSDNTYSLMFAMKQVKAFMDAGLPFDFVSEYEILKDSSILQDYKAIGFILPEMYNLFASDSLKNIVSAYSGAIWYGDAINGLNYYRSGYTDTTYLNSLRSFYDTHNLVRNNYKGYFVYVTGNKPFIFMLSRESSYSGTIEVNVKGWQLLNGDTTFEEYNSGTTYSATISGNKATFNVNLVPQQPYLFLLSSASGLEEQTRKRLSNSFSLFQNYPNPFNPQTTIGYQLPVRNNITIKIYNLLGQEVQTLVNENKNAGNHSVVWDGKDNSGRQVSSGVYYYKLRLDNGICRIKKLLLLK
ncbi:MAG: beta-galactosidase [Calditrichales bacterium]|nr:beta-galactosidase [Calditrichales bacterium]